MARPREGSAAACPSGCGSPARLAVGRFRAAEESGAAAATAAAFKGCLRRIGIRSRGSRSCARRQGRQDSNLRPTVLETAALPTELRPSASGRIVALAAMLSQRRALGLLFLVLTLGFAGIAIAAGREGVWVIAFAAAALGGWMATCRSRLRAAALQLRNRPNHAAYSLPVAKAEDTSALWLAVPQHARPGAPRPADPHLRAARQVRRRPPRQRPARARRRGRPRLVRAARPDRRDRALRPRPRASSSRPTRSRGSGARSSTSCARSTGCRARCAPARARSSARSPSSRRSSAARRPTRRSPTKLGITVEELEDEPDRHLPLLDRGARRALDGLGRRRPGRAASTRSRTRRARARSRALAETEMQGGARRGDLAPARAREARRHALLLRGADAARDRRGARRDRVARLAAAHEGDPAPARPGSAAPSARRRLDALAAATRLRFASVRTVSRGGADRMPAVEPGKIRNVAVVGHRGTGKTSLVEALLFQAGETNRLGTIDAGTTVSDWDDDEQRRADVDLALALPRRVAGPQAQPDRRARRPGLPGRGALARCASSRARSSSLSGVMGVEVGTVAALEARRGARDLARRLRQHARPRARRLLPRARGSCRSSSRSAASPSTCRSAPSTS